MKSRKFLKNILSFVIFTMLISFTGFTWAAEITKHHTDIEVKKSGDLLVVETITYDFGSVEEHSIQRKIKNIYQVSNQSNPVNFSFENFEIYLDAKKAKWTKSISKSRNTTLEIEGSEALTGIHKLTVIYEVKRAVMYYKVTDYEHFDIIKFDFVDDSRKIPISNISVSVFLPEPLSKDNTQIKTQTSNISDIPNSSNNYSISNSSSKLNSNWITLNQIDIALYKLPANERATVVLTYPFDKLEQNGAIEIEKVEQYADEETEDEKQQEKNKATLLPFILFILAMYLSYLFYFYIKYTKHRYKDISIQQYPPKGITAFGAGFLLDGFTKSKDIGAAILELGYLGHINIIDGSSGYIITKKTNKTTKNLTFDQLLFLDSILCREKRKLYFSNVGLAIFTKILIKFRLIKKWLFKWAVKSEYNSENTNSVRKKLTIVTFLFSIAIFPLLALSFEDSQIGFLSMILIVFLILAFIFAYYLIAGLFISISTSDIFSLILLISAIGLVGSIASLLFYIGKTSFNYAIAINTILILFFYVRSKVETHTKKGKEVKIHLLGLKAFIKKAKKEDIQKIVFKNPKYLDEILPYAMLFGEFKRWFEFYHILHIPTPPWYRTNLRSLFKSIKIIAVGFNPDLGK